MKTTPKPRFEEQLKNMALNERDVQLLLDIQAGHTMAELCTQYNISQGGLSKKKRRLACFIHQYDAANASK